MKHGPIRTALRADRLGEFKQFEVGIGSVQHYHAHRRTGQAEDRVGLCVVASPRGFHHHRKAQLIALHRREPVEIAGEDAGVVVARKSYLHHVLGNSPETYLSMVAWNWRMRVS